MVRLGYDRLGWFRLGQIRMWLVHSLLHTAIFSVRAVKGVTRENRNPGIEYQSEQLEKRFKQLKWIFCKTIAVHLWFRSKKKILAKKFIERKLL